MFLSSPGDCLVFCCLSVIRTVCALNLIAFILSAFNLVNSAVLHTTVRYCPNKHSSRLILKYTWNTNNNKDVVGLVYVSFSLFSRRFNGSQTLSKPCAIKRTLNYVHSHFHKCKHPHSNTHSKTQTHTYTHLQPKTWPGCQIKLEEFVPHSFYLLPHAVSVSYICPTVSLS